MGQASFPFVNGVKEGELVLVEKYEEKESDVNMASHIVWDATREDVGCIILLSNDTDLKMPLYIARKKFNKKIGIITPPKLEIHSDLKNISHFNRKTTYDILKQCQLPERIGRITKPPAWKTKSQK